MFPYWILFGCFALGCLVGTYRLRPADEFESGAFKLAFALLFVMLAFRSETGLDWPRYLQLFDELSSSTLGEAAAMRDPGFMVLNWLVANVGAPFWVVTFLCAIPFTRGLYRFAKLQPEPWIAALVAIPYLVIVVAMGYVRQGVAIGFILGGLAGLVSGKPYWRFILVTIVAATFHASAVFAVPLTMFGLNRDRTMQLVAAPIIVVLAYLYGFQNDWDRFVTNYVTSNLVSEGTGIRLALCVIPGVIFLAFKSRLALFGDEQGLWRNFSLVAIALTILFFILPASTAIDRVALYLLPLQLVVFARLPLLVGNRLGARLMVVALFAAILFVWLNFAQTAYGWIPYKMTVPFASA